MQVIQGRITGRGNGRQKKLVRKFLMVWAKIAEQKRFENKWRKKTTNKMKPKALALNFTKNWKNLAISGNIWQGLVVPFFSHTTLFGSQSRLLQGTEKTEIDPAADLHYFDNTLFVKKDMMDDKVSNRLKKTEYLAGKNN